MSRQSGSKPKHARPLASVAAPAAVSEIALLDRLAILASILLTLEQSATASAAEPSGSVEQVSIEPATAETRAAAGRPPTRRRRSNSRASAIVRMQTVT